LAVLLLESTILDGRPAGLPGEAGNIISTAHSWDELGLGLSLAILGNLKEIDAFNTQSSISN